MPYYICEFCNKAIKVEDFDKHKKENHSGQKPIPKKEINLKKILDRAKIKYARDDKLIIRTSFDIAKKIIEAIEKIDASEFSIIYDYQIPKSFFDILIPTTHPPHPPIMLHIRGVIKDKKTYNELIKKYKGTRDEEIIKSMVGSREEIIVCYKNYLNYLIQWKEQGKKFSDIVFLMVFFFLHEIYHILGEGEKMADINASIAMLKTLSQRIEIPDYEIERWKEYEEFQKKYSQEHHHNFNSKFV